MARVDYVDGRSCHVTLTLADVRALQLERVLVVERDAPDVPRALVVVLDEAAA